jgi:hypothetical protein
VRGAQGAQEEPKTGGLAPGRDCLRADARSKRGVGAGALAEAVAAAYVANMLQAKIATVVLSMAVLLAAADAASARPRSQASSSVPTCNGTPIIMQGLECRSGSARARPSERAELPRIPRGSSGYLPPVPAPRAPSLTLQRPSVTPYMPPPINSFSDRVTQCNQSFTFNAGVGNNPAGRDAYVRSCAN